MYESSHEEKLPLKLVPRCGHITPIKRGKNRENLLRRDINLMRNILVN